MSTEESTEEFLRRARKSQTKLEAHLVARLLKKGLKANWSERDFVGFISVIAGLHKQTKDWQFPSDSMYMALDPRTLTVLVFCLEKKREVTE